VAISAGAWVAYRKVDRHLIGLHRRKYPLPERTRRPPMSAAGSGS